MKVRILLLALLAVFQLTACSTKIISAEGGYNDVVIKLDNNDNDNDKKYYLRSLGYNGSLSEAIAQNGVLNFRINKFPQSDNCFYLTDAKGEILNFVDRNTNGFRNYLWSDYTNRSLELDSLNQSITRYEIDINDAEYNYQIAETWLSNHQDIHYSNQCFRPPRGERPTLACNKKERRDKSIAICIIQKLGCGFMSKFVGKIAGRTVVKFVSGSACDLITDELIKPENSPTFTLLKNATLFGIAKYFGIIGKSISLGIASIEFVNCIDTVQDICTKQYEKWKNKPIEMQNECISMIQSQNDERGAIDRYKRYLSSGYKEIDFAHQSLLQLKRQYTKFDRRCSVR